jgi:bis(5'-nucleosyl)-tetraphosphatase (symmetrical)
MAIYAIGDIQGCFDDLLRLVDKINFDPTADQLWFTGDLVNRGPKSLETLRYVKNLGKAAVTVLGNHDLHLLAIASKKQKLRKKDSLYSILVASDRDELLYWLRHQPLLHYQHKFCMVHAGLPSQWGLKKAQKMAKKVEQILQGPNYQEFLKNMYGDSANMWSPELKGSERARFIVNGLTRIRFCTAKGKLDFKYHGAPGTQPDKLIPWFEVPDRKSTSVKIIFGHWSMLGFYAGNNCYGLDTGCLWGRQLTALKLDTPGLDGGTMERTSIESSVIVNVKVR